MSYLPYLVRLAPGSDPQIEDGFPVASVDQSLVAVSFPLPAHRHGGDDPYLTTLLQTQQWYGRPLPSRAELVAAVDTLAAAVSASDGALTVTVLLGLDGTVFATGATTEASTGTPVTIVTIPAAIDALSPREPWQAHALATNSRASIDAFARMLGEQGAQDAIVLHDDGSVVPVLGALLLQSEQRLRTASASTVSPDLVGALTTTGRFTALNPASTTAGITIADLDSATAAWWLGPDFTLRPVAVLAGRNMQVPADTDALFAVA